MSQDRLGWWQQVRAQWPYYSVVSALFLFVSFGCVGFVAWQRGANHFLEYVLAFMDPAMGAMAFLVAATLSPALTAGKPFSSVHIGTLPLTFLTLIVVLKSAFNDAYSGMQRFADLERYDLLWQSIPFLMITWVGLCVSMVLVAGARSRSTAADKP